MFNSIKNALLGANKYTHALAVVILTVAGFVSSSAGQAVVSQYPKTAAIAAVILALAGLYRKPS